MYLKNFGKFTEHNITALLDNPLGEKCKVRYVKKGIRGNLFCPLCFAF